MVDNFEIYLANGQATLKIPPEKKILCLILQDYNTTEYLEIQNSIDQS